jgi:hypothetical protein
MVGVVFVEGRCDDMKEASASETLGARKVRKEECEKRWWKERPMTPGTRGRV